MKKFFLVGLCFILGACASAPTKKVVVWETENIPRAYDVLGPVSATEQIPEKTEDAIQGLAGFISKDGRISGEVPPDIQKALDIKRDMYKDMIYEKLGKKAQEYEADAIIATEYFYLPPYASFSTKATVSAKGTMIKYKT